MLKDIKTRHRVIWGFIAAFSLWLRCGVPLFALANAGDDDALFVRLARSLSRGHWLGHYDNVTLAKGMFYPLFIALSGFLCIPLKLAEQAVYLLVSALTARFLARRSGSWAAGTILFAALAFNPILYSVSLARVIREGLYISLSLAGVALAVGVAFPRLSRVKRLWLALAAGLVLGAFWLTREEGPWILPALFIILAVAVATILRRRDIPEFYALAASTALFLLGFVALTTLVAFVNQRSYGVYETVEFKSRNFVRAYSALAGIESKDWQPKVVIPAEARRRAYAVSPAAKELQPAFEGAIGETWRANSCSQTLIAAGGCPEILAGWFMWALRDAVTAAGHTGSAKEADAFYGQLADQLEAACAAGRLACTHRRPSLAPPFRIQYLQQTLLPARDLLVTVFTMGQGVTDPPADTGAPRQLDIFTDLTAVAPVATDIVHEAAGWAGARSATPSFILKGPSGDMALWQMLAPPGPLAAAHPGWSMEWFDLSYSCQQNCDLGMAASDATPLILPTADLKTALTLNKADKLIHFDRVETSERLPVTAARQRLQRRIAGVFTTIYHCTVPIAAILALAGLGLATIRRRGPPIEIYTLALASLVAVACRIALLSYLDVTSIPSNNELYASPAMPFALVFVVTGIYCGWAAWRKPAHNRRARDASFISAQQTPGPPP